MKKSSPSTFYGLQNGLKLKSLKAAAKNYYVAQLSPEYFLHIVFYSDELLRFCYRKNSELLAPELACGDAIENKNCESELSADTIYGKKLIVEIDPDPLAIKILDAQTQEIISEDVPGLGFWTDGQEVRCYKKIESLSDKPKIYGLGDKTGCINRWGQRFRNAPLDALGYDSKSSDPLYKDIPFWIVLQGKDAHGYFFDNFSHKFFDFGKERKPIPYYHFAAASGEMNYFFFKGPSIKEVVSSYCKLTGLSPLMPKFSFGYLASSMTYCEAGPEENSDETENAEEKILAMLDKAISLETPATAFHLSSGYILDVEKRRMQFQWNQSKFPQPLEFAKKAKEKNVELCANVKPVILEDHSEFKNAAKEKIFLEDENGEALVTDYWSGKGAHLDFKKAEAQKWWKEKLKTEILGKGVRGIWNDNNEYEIFAKHNREGYESEMSLIMSRIASEASLEADPTRRPWVLSRSGYAGIQKYAQTWTGDNYSSWEALRYDNAIISSMNISGLVHTGCDIGGFWGETPSPELLLRWIQNGVFMPRFCIHSYKKEATEAWSYAASHPEHFRIVQKFMKLRSKLLPYLYQLNYHAHKDGSAIQRPLVYDFQNDEKCHEESFHYMLGESLLIAPIAEPSKKGISCKKIYLPAGSNWINLFTGKSYAGGEQHLLKFRLDEFPVFVRANSVIPILKNDKELEFKIYSNNKNKKINYEFFDDDGDSQNSAYKKIEFEFDCKENSMKIIKEEGDYKIPYDFKASFIICST